VASLKYLLNKEGIKLCREEIEVGWDMQRQIGALRSILSEEQWIQH
jgi:hypothetical protein